MKCQSANSVALGAEVETYTCSKCGAENPLVDAGPVETAVDPLVGAVISDCKILEKLGEGGFGAVYKAMDQNLQRPVALKVMLQSLTSSQEFVQKFIREAITASQLNHPNIVAIHKVGRDEKRGIHFLIMELLEGKTLEHMVQDKGVLKPEEGVPLMLQAAEALAAAHDKKIVHRAIKPENLMVDRRGVVKIMDFGLAKVVQPDMKSTKVMGKLVRYGTGKCLLTYGITGDQETCQETREMTGEIIRSYRGLYVGQSAGKALSKSRFLGPYLRNSLWSAGYAIDTLESALPWSSIPAAAQAVADAIRVSQAAASERVLVLCHISHIYADGASMYLTYLFPRKPDPDHTLELGKGMKAAASQAIVHFGGTISHQHGVGSDHRPYLAAEKGELGLKVLESVCRTFDPDGMMNPGKLVN